MCAHNVSGHGISCRQPVCTPYQLTNIQACASPNKFHHLTCECERARCIGSVGVNIKFPLGVNIKFP